MENNLVVQDEMKELQSYSPQGLISQALAQNLPIETLERLMDLADRWETKQAKTAFLRALTEFQSIVPVLKKKKRVSFNTTKYNYTPLADIVAGIKEAEEKTGLSHRWEIEEKDDSIICTCIISHIAGHSEKTSLSAKRDSSGNKNEIQSRGSAVTYLQRYTLIGALGISTADEDNDGSTSGSEKQKEAIPDPKEKVNWSKLIKNCDSKEELNSVWNRMSDSEKKEHKATFTKIKTNIESANKKEGN